MESLDYLKVNFSEFLRYLNFAEEEITNYQSLISDKYELMQQHLKLWNGEQIPLNRAALLFILSYTHRFERQIGDETDPTTQSKRCFWVVLQYPKYRAAIHALEALRLSSRHLTGFPHSTLAWAEAHNARLDVQNAFAALKLS